MGGKLTRSSPSTGSVRTGEKKHETLPNCEARTQELRKLQAAVLSTKQGKPAPAQNGGGEQQESKAERGKEGVRETGSRRENGWISGLQTWLLLILETCASQVLSRELKKVAFS